MAFKYLVCSLHHYTSSMSFCDDLHLVLCIFTFTPFIPFYYLLCGQHHIACTLCVCVCARWAHSQFVLVYSLLTLWSAAFALLLYVRRLTGCRDCRGCPHMPMNRQSQKLIMEHFLTWQGKMSTPPPHALSVQALNCETTLFCTC